MNEDERIRRQLVSLSQHEEAAYLQQIRGQMVYHIDSEHKLSRELPDKPCRIHVFCTRSAPIAVNSPLYIERHEQVDRWFPAWCEYVINAASREAVKKLSNGKLPNEFYQLRLKFEEICRSLSSSVEGPFVLLTAQNINKCYALESALRNLSIRDQYRMLSASYIRHLP